jgi:hypothetical protein
MAGIRIEFGGKPRDVFFGITQLGELEAQLGMIPMRDVMNQLAGLGINAMVAALYIGLKDDDKSLTINLIRKMLDDYIRPRSAGGEGKRVKVLADALSEALDATGLFRDEKQAAAEAAEAEAAEGN